MTFFEGVESMSLRVLLADLSVQTDQCRSTQWSASEWSQIRANLWKKGHKSCQHTSQLVVPSSKSNKWSYEGKKDRHICRVIRTC